MQGTYSHRRTLILVVVVVAVTLGASGAVQAASMEIWPSERRANNTFFCYGNDWNSMLIAIYPEDHGKHRFELPDQFVEPTVLTVTLPEAVEFLGANFMGVPGMTHDLPVEAVTIDDRAYQRVSVPLHNETLNHRLHRGRWYYHVFIWFAAPETLDDTVAWELHHGDTQLVTGGSRLVTAGVVADGRPLAQRFKFYPYGIQTTVPNSDFDRMADFYRRFGIAGLESHWTYGLPADEPTDYHRKYEANRRHGVKNIANMTLFARKHAGNRYHGSQAASMPHGGLTPAIDAACEGLESEEALEDWRAAHHFFDMAMWDWEPAGPSVWPGYEDEATIAAFAEARGIEGELTAERLRAEYREHYARFRMEQIARPLYSMRRTIDAVHTIPFRVEQGSGATSHVAYDVYGHDFDALTPMVYQPSPLGYARNVMEMLANTTVPAEKFWPDMTIGWSTVPVHRNTPDEFLMDTVLTAAAGCGSVSHWPGIHYCDAVWFGIHEGLARIALVEDFYLDGAKADGIAMRGLPYREEQISLGHITLDHSTPDWGAALITFAHELGPEHLLTLLNYHGSEDCFVRISAPALANRYLVNPVDSTYQVLDGNGRAVVHVASVAPGLWIATADEARIQGCERIDGATVEARFAEARDAFLAAETRSEVQLGTVGDITTGYALTDFGGEERVTLQVETPTQKIAFGASGGRVFDWEVEGMDKFVAAENHGTDGFIMDMLWLPASARWSGDEVEELSLITCSNDGTEAVVVYEGHLRSGLPGVRLRKAYRVPAEGNTLAVEITLRNDRVDETPVVFAYWSHNVLDVNRAYFIGTQLTDETAKGVTTILPAEGLAEELLREVLMPQRIIGETGPAYAEFFPDRDAGLIFRLPDNFMNVYRWSAYGKPVFGSEWMSQPMSISAGGSATVSFSITAVPEATPESLRAALAATAPAAADTGNLFPYGFGNLTEAGLPADWRIRTGGEGADEAQVTAETDETGAVVVTARMAREANVHIDTARRTPLDPDGNYMFVVQMKVNDMHHVGNWYQRPAGVRVYVYGMDNKHTWLAIHGEGNTDGWVTGVVPFPYNDEVRPQFGQSNILLRCSNMTGTVSFRNPMILRRPAGMEIQRHFEMEDGSRVFSSHLQLRR